MDTEPDPFLQALGKSPNLPAAIRAFHQGGGRYHGRCSITRGRGRLIALALWAGGFPPAGDDVPVAITIRRNDKDWLWVREFAGHRTRSHLRFDERRGCVRERMGALTLWLRPVLTQSGIAIDIHRVSVLGIPCPRMLRPRSTSSEGQDDQSRFYFDIGAHAPGLGVLIRYTGWLVPDGEKQGVA